jgi:putative alpha-1,2-mannosidase
MVPHDARGLLDAMGGSKVGNDRLDALFRNPDGSLALTGCGELRAELDNEPSIAAPFMYLFSGRPHRTQEIVRAAANELWSDTPYGIPGNDDLGAMSAWYVFAALGIYPGIPGRAEMLLGSPLFPRAVVRRANGRTITIEAPAAAAKVPYVHGLLVDGKSWSKPWLPESFVEAGGALRFTLAPLPEPRWGSAAEDAPPSMTSPPTTARPGA